MKYFGEWKSYDDMVNELHRGEYDYETRNYKLAAIPDNFPIDDEILFAAYGTEPYEGDAVIVYEQSGKLYLMTGGHCSCYGLNESMGGPEETDRAALGMMTLGSGCYYYDDEARKAFRTLFPKLP